MKIEVSSFRNRTTRTELRAGYRIYADQRPGAASGQKFEMAVAQILEQGLVIELPTHSCAPGHKIDLAIEVPRKGNSLIFEASCTVDEVRHQTEAADQVKLTLAHFKTEDWAALQSVLQQNQEQVMSLFKQLKG